MRAGSDRLERGAMPLRPADETTWTAETRGVRIYLDDIEHLTSKLEAYAKVEVTLRHRDAPDSVYDSIDDLIGRKDIVAVKIYAPKTGSSYGYTSIDISPLWGVRTRMVGENDIPQSMVDHFSRSLERAPRRLARMFRRPDADLVLDRRASSLSGQDRRRHDVVLSLVSGAVGALVGAVATIVAALITK